jgi:hypothetical protein
MWQTNHKMEPLNIVSWILIFISSGSKQQHNMLNRMKVEVPRIAQLFIISSYTKISFVSISPKY